MSNLQSYAGSSFYQEGLNFTEASHVRGDSMEFWLKPLVFNTTVPDKYKLTLSGSAAAGATVLPLSTVVDAATNASTLVKIYRRDVLWFDASGVLAVAIDDSTVVGTDTPTTAAVLTITVVAHVITAIGITTPGVGYKVAPTIAVGGTATTPPVFNVVLNATGGIASIAVVNGGVFSTDPTTATATAYSNLNLNVLPLTGALSSNDFAYTYALFPYLSFTDGGVPSIQGQEATSRNKGQGIFNAKMIASRNSTIDLNGTVYKNDPIIFELEYLANGTSSVYWQSRHAAYQLFDTNGTQIDKGQGISARQGVAFVLTFTPQSPVGDFLKLQCQLSVEGQPRPYELLGLVNNPYTTLGIG